VHIVEAGTFAATIPATASAVLETVRTATAETNFAANPSSYGGVGGGGSGGGGGGGRSSRAGGSGGVGRGLEGVRLGGRGAVFGAAEILAGQSAYAAGAVALDPTLLARSAAKIATPANQSVAGAGYAAVIDLRQGGKGGGGGGGGSGGGAGGAGVGDEGRSSGGALSVFVLQRSHFERACFACPATFAAMVRGERDR